VTWTPTTLRIEHVGAGRHDDRCSRTAAVLAGEIVDAAVMRKAALQAFLAEQVADAQAQGVLFSVHLKATMMKVSDPIIFGHAVRAYFAEVFEQYADELASVGADPNQGLGGVLADVATLPDDARTAVEQAIAAAYDRGPALAQVDSSRGITNLHVPSDVIIDASMPAAIRSSGQMWNAADELQDAKYVIPDSSYAALYDETVGTARARRLRPDDDGHDAQRRPHGAEGRGVRQPRQDLRGPRRRAPCVVGRGPAACC
jgi:isocitrate dehydrogenase